MNTPLYLFRNLEIPSLKSIRWFSAFASIAFAINVEAQSVIYSAPSSPLAPRIVQDSTPEKSPLAPDYRDAVSGTPIEFGQLRIFPHLQVTYMHATGLPLGQGTTPIDSDITSITAGLTAELGQHWILNYTPSWVNYSAQSMTDSFNQSFLLNGATTTVSEWDLRIGVGFQSSNSTIAETAKQTKQNTWTTDLSATHKLGQRSSYEGTARLNDHYGEGFPDTRDWSTQQWVKMKMTEKTNIGLGLNLGYTEITKAADMEYVQYLGQFNWQSTEKIAVSAQGGIENRHSMSASARDVHNPILQASLGYQPFEHTRLTFTDFINVSSSFYDNSITKNKGWNVALNQRLLEKLNLELTYSDQTSDYSSFGGISTVGGRSDDVTSFSTSLSVVAFKKWTLAAVYNSSKNTSNLNGYSFSTTTYGVEIGGRF